MRILHIVTVGTSIVRNAAQRSDKYAVLEKWREKLKCWAFSGVKSECDVEAGHNASPRSDIFKDVLSVVCDDPYGFSAELNSTLRFIEKYPGNHDLILYVTDTGTGWFSANIVEEAIRTCPVIRELCSDKKSDLRIIGKKMIQGFGIDFWKGLINLVREVTSDIVSRRRDYDLITANLTAGFKPETGFLLLVASLIGVDKAYYIHETMRDLVEVPIIPLKISDSFRRILENVIKGVKPLQTELQVLKRLGFVKEDRVPLEVKELFNILLKYT